MSVTVNASATTVDATNSVTLTAAVANDTKSAGVTWSLSGVGTLSNQTGTSVTYTAPSPSSTSATATVTATSAADTTRNASVRLTIPAAPSITTSALTSAMVGAAYSVTLAGSGGIAPYTWKLTSGTLPSSMTFTTAGVLSGTPTASEVGATSLTFELTDSGKSTPLTASKTLQLVVNAAPAITFTTTTLANATINTAYSASVTATGGGGPLTYSLTSGPLPTGVSLSTVGVISGTPTVAGTFPISVKAADAFGDTATQALSLQVTYPPLAISPNGTLPAGYAGTPYTQTLTASGGSGTGYTWSTDAAGTTALTAVGLSFSSGGVVSGATPVQGAAAFNVTVTDSASNTRTIAFSVKINTGLSITTATTLPTGYSGTAYSQTLAAVGGSGTGYTWSTNAAGTTALTAVGLSLSSGGVVSGATPVQGTAAFNVTVTDSASNTRTVAFSVVINPALTVTTTTLPSGYLGGAYSGAALAATGGSGAGYTWVATGLPTGLVLSAGGALSGTPTQSGTFNVNVTVTDSAGNQGLKTLSLVVEPALTITTGTTLPAGIVSSAYSQSLAATGGSGTGYTWTTDASGTASLAAVGLALSSAGAVSGATPIQGSANFNVTVTDSETHTATAVFAVTIDATLTITTSATLPSGYTGTAYSQSLAAAGGSGTGYTWSTDAAGTTALSAVGLSLSSGGVLSGTPAATGTANFTTTVTDSNSNTANEALSVVIYAPLSLPTGGALTQATINQSYSTTITASGGAPNYAWTVNGSAVPVSLGNGLTASSTGNDTLTITGTPTATGTVNLSVSVKDGANTTVGPNAYSIEVTQAAYNVGGQITLQNACGGVSSTVPAITVSLYTSPGGTLVTSTTTGSSGNYSFGAVAKGAYTITPSISGPSSAFYPGSQSITVSNADLTTENFSAQLGYTVSGTASYAGTQSGQTYLSLTDNNCSYSPFGTSIATSGAFTIHGVPPGTYTLSASMDTLGDGTANVNFPSGTSGTAVTVVTADVTTAAVTLTDPAAVSFTSGPTIQVANPMEQGAVLAYLPVTDSNGTEMATSYTVQWSTDSNFTTVTGSHTFAATGTNGANVWILSGLTDSASYYFRAQAQAGSSTSAYSTTVGPITIGAPSTGNTISGQVTFTGTATGPLYVGFYDQTSGKVFAAPIASPVSPQSFSVMVPTGSNYFFFGIVDQNNDGLVDPGDIQNTNLSSSTGVSSSTTMNLTLPTADSTGAIATQHTTQTTSTGTTSGYRLSLNITAGNKLPVAVQIVSGPNINAPIDMGVCTYCGNPKFTYTANIGSGTVPVVGDTYSFDVTYSDSPTPSAVTAQVTGVLNAPVTAMSPSGNVPGQTTPTFIWTDPASASSYTYQFYLSDNAGNMIWQIPQSNSNSSGFASSITSITWGTDPTGDSTNTPTVLSLTTGQTYNWVMTVMDSSGNTDQTITYFIP